MADHAPPRTIIDTIARLPRPMSQLLPVPLYSGHGGPCSALAVEAMKRHMTDEGWQIMQGLEENGYTLYGPDLPNGESDVEKILKSDHGTLIVQDKREWERDPRSNFQNIQALKDWPGIFKLTILKDSHQKPGYHRQSAEEIGCHAWIVYYHPRIVHHLAPYTRVQHMVRTYHSIDPDVVPPFQDRPNSCLLSGVMGGRVYPLRTRLAALHSGLPHCKWMQHPGYHTNGQGSVTPDYLKELARHRVAFCTSSIYGYALRKIVEASACGCVVISDLPKDEVMPEIDSNIARVGPNWKTQRIARIVQEIYDTWNPQRQYEVAERAKKFYDYRATCKRLVDDIETLRRRYND